jgi:Flp pilus assembly pilin Flp
VLRALADDGGVTLVEYAVLLSLIAVVCVLSVQLVGHNTNILLSSAAHAL